MTMGFDDAGGQRRQVLSVFDFDGTLTRHDSFVPFLKFAFGPREFNRRILRLALPSVRFLARRLNRDELKAQLISTFLTGVEMYRVQKQAVKFCGLFWVQLMRPSSLKSIASELEAGAGVPLCSAPSALVLQPFADRFGIKLIYTELEVLEGLLQAHDWQQPQMREQSNQARCCVRASTGLKHGVTPAATSSCSLRPRTTLATLSSRMASSSPAGK